MYRHKYCTFVCAQVDTDDTDTDKFVYIVHAVHFWLNWVSVYPEVTDQHSNVKCCCNLFIYLHTWTSKSSSICLGCGHNSTADRENTIECHVLLWLCREGYVDLGCLLEARNDPGAWAEIRLPLHVKQSLAPQLQSPEIRWIVMLHNKEI